MTATRTPGLPTVEDGLLVSTNPATGEEAARVRIAGADDVAAAVERARAAAAWWAGLGVAGRRTRLLQFRSILANRMPEIADLLHRECGKPLVEGVMEHAAAIPTSRGRPATPAGCWGRTGYARQRSPWSTPPGWSTSRSA
jgi:acyl-CoA reductase-like NAD-dependent aldehyde dehydrogenase